MGTKQAAFPGAGAGLGPLPGSVGLGANARACGGGVGGSLLQGWAGPGRQTPGLPSPPCSERAHEPLPADPSICTLGFSFSVHLVLDAVWGWKRQMGVSGEVFFPPWDGPLCAPWFCAWLSLQGERNPFPIPVGPALL